MNPITQTFLEEASDLLEKWEEVCLELESEIEVSPLNTLFRAAHSLKGSAKSVGFNKFGNFVHHTEDFLTACLKDSSLMDEEALGFLFEIHSFLESWYEVLSTSEESDPDHSDLDAKQELEKRQLELMVKKGIVDAAPEVEETAEVEDMGFHLFEEEEPEEQQTSNSPVSPVGTIKNLENENVVADSKAKDAANSDTKKLSKNSNVIKIPFEKIEKISQPFGRIRILLEMMHDLMIEEKLTLELAEAFLADVYTDIKVVESDVARLRLIPIYDTFKNLSRIGRDVARKLDKNIKVSIKDNQVELDRPILNVISDALTHIVRNAIDHGLETKAERSAQTDKPPVGNLEISAKYKGNLVEIVIQDDGRGLNKEKLIAKAQEKGIDVSDELPDEKIYGLIMQPGFSTANQVTEISGRGVGMDVVRSNIESLSGKIEIKSEFGKGTKFIITVPLSNTVQPGFVVNNNEFQYAMTVNGVHQIVSIEDVDSSAEYSQVKFGDKVIRYISLDDFLEGKKYSKITDKKILLILQLGDDYAALGVDQVCFQQPIMLKEVTERQSFYGAFSGSTLLRDGRNCMVINTQRVFDLLSEMAA